MPAALVRRSDDTSAPVLTGQSGSLISLLDAVLVDGYGDKAALGWTKPYSDTNEAAYRIDPTDGTGFYIYIDDSFGTYAEIRGYESMTAIDSGTNPFPYTSLTKVRIVKSDSSDSTARPWIIYGDNRGIWLLVYRGYTDFYYYSRSGLHWIGDFITKVPSDTWACAVIGGNSTTDSPLWQLRYFDQSPGASYLRAYAARLSDGTGSSSDNAFKLIQSAASSDRVGQYGLGSSEMQDGKPLYIPFGGVCDCASNTYRGALPIMYNCMQQNSVMRVSSRGDGKHYAGFVYHSFVYPGTTTYGGALFDLTGDFRVYPHP